jgi:hypothetical protein
MMATTPAEDPAERRRAAVPAGGPRVLRNTSRRMAVHMSQCYDDVSGGSADE